MLNSGDLQSLGYLIGMCDDDETKSLLSRIKNYIEEHAQQANNNARDEICPWCNGRGKRVGQFNEEICNVCGGTGKGKHSPVA